MELIKKHYEKVLLGVVLLGLTVGAALLPWMISNERASLQALADEIINHPIKQLPPLDLSQATNLLQRVATPMTFDFSSDNRLFNPVPWQKTPDGRWLKITADNGIGVDAVTVTKITPLYTTLALDSVLTSESGARYMILVTREAATRPVDRGRRMTGASLNEKNKEGFTIVQVKGPPANPADLVLELTDTNDRVSLSKGKPFKRADGYMADLKYPPDNRTWINQRVGMHIRIVNEDYNIVYIGTNEVVLSAPSGKKTSRPFNPGP
jgi:hypothetical protein